MLGGSPLLPAINWDHLSTSDLGVDLPIFILGLAVLLVLIFVVKKLRLFTGALMTKEEHQFVDKARRALGVGDRNVPIHHVSADRALTARVQ